MSNSAHEKVPVLAALTAGAAGGGCLGILGSHVVLLAVLALPLGLLAAAFAVRLVVRDRPSLAEWTTSVVKVISAVRHNSTGRCAPGAVHGTGHPTRHLDRDPPAAGQRHVA